MERNQLYWTIVFRNIFDTSIDFCRIQIFIPQQFDIDRMECGAFLCDSVFARVFHKQTVSRVVKSDLEVVNGQ